jgi:hypothetical protein
VIAVIGGLLLVGGAIQALVQLRRQRVVGTP